MYCLADHRAKAFPSVENERQATHGISYCITSHGSSASFGHGILWLRMSRVLHTKRAVRSWSDSWLAYGDMAIAMSFQLPRLMLKTLGCHSGGSEYLSSVIEEGSSAPDIRSRAQGGRGRRYGMQSAIFLI